MPEEGQDLEALEQAAALMDRRPVEQAARAALERVEALRQLAEAERQSEQGVPQEAVDPPAPLAERAPGLVPGALPVGTEHLLAALERAQAVDPVVFGPVAARPAAENPLVALAAGLEQAGHRWAEALRPLAEALQVRPAGPDPSEAERLVRAVVRRGLAGPPQEGRLSAETLRQAAEPYQAGPEYPAASHQPGVPGQEWEAPHPSAAAQRLATEADPGAEAPAGWSHPVAEPYPGAAADLYRRQAELGWALAQEAALLRQAVADLAGRLQRAARNQGELADLEALARLAGFDPVVPQHPAAVPDLPEAQRQAALTRAVSRRLVVLYPRAGQQHQEELTDRVVARLAAHPAGE